MRDVPTAPNADAYWVEPGRVLAGAYPGDPDATAARERLAGLRETGVTLFVDLTEPDELLAPYAHLLEGARHERRSIPDFGTASQTLTAEILDLVDAERAAGGCVYLHCRGGIGRTGTIVGCWLVRHGLADGDPIARIAVLRRGTADALAPSPQTPAQQERVRDWRTGD